MSKKAVSRELKVHGKHVKLNVLFNPAELEMVKEIAGIFFRTNRLEIIESELDDVVSVDAILEMALDALQNVLETEPSLVITDYFSVNLAITNKMNEKFFGQYFSGISFSSCAFIGVNGNLIADHFLHSLKKFEDDTKKVHEAMFHELRYILNHELRHHFESRIINNKVKTSKNILKRERNVLPVFHVYILAARVREEGVTTFEGMLKKGKFTFKMDNLRKLIDGLRNIKDIRLLNSLSISRVPYDAGSAMCLMIALNYLRKNSAEQEKAEIYHVIRHIDEVMDSPDKFTLILSKETIRKCLLVLSKLSMEEFFKEYEKACKKLKLSKAKRLITWRKYRQVMKKAYKESLELIEIGGFSVDSIIKEIRADLLLEDSGDIW
ncbi:hypothetical protein ACFL0W_03130 [Nanoarchaeota archaeon]